MIIDRSNIVRKAEKFIPYHENDTKNGLKKSRKELCIEGQNKKKEIRDELIKKYFETMNSSVLPF